MKKRLLSFVLALSLCGSLTLCDWGGYVNAAGKTAATNASVTLKSKKVKKITLKVKQSVKLKLKNAKKKVTYSSSKKKVAKVTKKGKVTALKVGAATITAKSGKKKYKCRVTVISGKNVNKDSEGQATTQGQATTTQEQATTTQEQATTTQEQATTTQEQATTTQGQATTTQGQATTTQEQATTTQEQATTTQGQATTTESQSTEDTAKVDAGEYSLTNVHNGEGTFYDRETPGACNLDDYEAVYYTVAMQTEDYMNNMAGAYIEITDKDGDKVQAMVTDRLPEGKKGDIDMTRKTFLAIEPEITGRMNITWRIIPLPTDEPICYKFKPTSSEYWAEVQVRNHRYPVKSLEYFDNNTKQYVALERKEYNYFAAANGMGKGPYTFRVTDIYGHVCIDENIPLDTSEKLINGKANFPY